MKILFNFSSLATEKKKNILFKVVSTVSLIQELKTLKRPKHGMNGHALVQHLSVLKTGLRRTIVNGYYEVMK